MQDNADTETFKIEVQRTQTQIVEIQATSLEEALKIVDRRDFVLPEDEWSTFKDAWAYLVPLDDEGEYDEDGDWTKQ